MQYTVHNVYCTCYSYFITLYNIHCTMYIIKCNTVQCTFYVSRHGWCITSKVFHGFSNYAFVRYTLYNIHYIVYNVYTRLCTLYTCVHCTLYTCDTHGPWFIRSEIGQISYYSFAKLNQPLIDTRYHLISIAVNSSIGSSPCWLFSIHL